MYVPIKPAIDTPIPARHGSHPPSHPIT